MVTAEALTGKNGPKIFTADGQPKKGGTVKSKSANDDVCLTSGCVHAASKMLDQMDQNVEPCDDFYNFACGAFVDNTIIPDDKVSVNTFSVISDKLQEQLRTIVTAPIHDDEIEPFKNVKRLYLACMNKSRMTTYADETFVFLSSSLTLTFQIIKLTQLSSRNEGWNRYKIFTIRWEDGQ